MKREVSLPLSTSRTLSARRRVRPGMVARHAILIVFCAVAMTPVIWVFCMSLKSVAEAYRTPLTFFPTHPTLAAYGYAFANIPSS